MYEHVFDKVLIHEKHPYLRPFICKGDPKKSKVFLVGTNPATPIYSSDIPKHEYINLIQDYEKFLDFYSKIRRKKNKPTISRTRQGITSFLQWLKSIHPYPILETDIYTYPTENVEMLDKVNQEIIDFSQKVFVDILKENKPQLVILYGKRTVNSFLQLIKRENWKCTLNRDEGLAVSYLEMNPPFGKITLENHSIHIVVARHLMYYGKTGDSYGLFKSKLTEIFEKLNLVD